MSKKKEPYYNSDYKPYSVETSKRKKITAEQSTVLEEAFQKNKLPSNGERVYLSNKLDMDLRRVQVWFQNRRAKEKKKQNESISTRSNDFEFTQSNNEFQLLNTSNQQIQNSSVTGNIPPLILPALPEHSTDIHKRSNDIYPMLSKKRKSFPTSNIDDEPPQKKQVIIDTLGRRDSEPISLPPIPLGKSTIPPISQFLHQLSRSSNDNIPSTNVDSSLLLNSTNTSNNSLPPINSINLSTHINPCILSDIKKYVEDQNYNELCKILNTNPSVDLSLCTIISSNWTLLHSAASVGNSLICNKILEKKQININTQESEHLLTPLHIATIYGYSNIIYILIEEGCDVNILDKLNRTALYCACSFGYEACVRALLTTNVDINIPNNDNYTPLQVAALQGHTSIVNLLEKYSL